MSGVTGGRADFKKFTEGTNFNILRYFLDQLDTRFVQSIPQRNNIPDTGPFSGKAINTFNFRKIFHRQITNYWPTKIQVTHNKAIVGLPDNTVGVTINFQPFYIGETST